MSVYPYYFFEERPRHYPLDDEDYLLLDPLNRNANYMRSMRHGVRDMGSSIKSDKDKFQVNIDVQHFTPEEIIVKVVDGQVVVEARHDEKPDEHGFVMRQFARRYFLPEDCDFDAIESRLSSDGVLSIICPKRSEPSKVERRIHIVRTGPIRKELKEEIDESKKEEKAED